MTIKISPMNYHCECGAVMLATYPLEEIGYVTVRCLSMSCTRRNQKRRVRMADADEVPLEEGSSRRKSGGDPTEPRAD